MDKDDIIKKLAEENAKLKEELQATKEHLKKYTAPASSKIYYEKHKELVKERVKKCREKTIYKSTPEQRKEYDKRLNRERVNRYRQANKDTEEYKLKHKEQTYKYRKEHPDTIKKLNQKHSKAHKDKVKQTKLQTQTTASTTIQNAIRNELARNALQNRKQELLNNTNDLKAKLNATVIANDFLNLYFQVLLMPYQKPNKE